MRRFLLTLLCIVATASFASRPIRHLLTRNAQGETVVLPFSGHQHRYDRIQTCFTSTHHHRSTRAFHTIDPDGLGRYGESAAGVLPSIGQPNIPVIMVEFDDVAFQPTTTPELVTRFFNEKGFNSDKKWGGSVRDYFVDQSYGLFSPTFTVLGKVKLPKTRAYYGANSGGDVNININEFYESAVQQSIQTGVSFRPFKNPQRRIPLVILYFAGASENSAMETGSEDYIWSHFRGLPLTQQEYTFQSYLVVGELINYYKSENGRTVRDAQNNPIVSHSELEGPGVKCHELCHALGLPDFYDTTNSYYDTPDYHDLMDYGQYCMTMGERPIGLSAYERNCLGWLRIMMLEQKPSYFQLLPLNVVQTNPLPANNAQAFALRNPNNPSECYVLENRQPSTWFPQQLGSGMLVFHVDYDASAWEANRVNVDAVRQRYGVVPADNKRQTHSNGKPADFRGDFFPGTKGVTTWSNETSPALSWREGAENRALYGISLKESSLNVGFAFNDSTLTSIRSVITATDHGDGTPLYYGLDGRPQAAPLVGGIYIHNGHKELWPRR